MDNVRLEPRVCSYLVFWSVEKLLLKMSEMIQDSLSSRMKILANFREFVTTAKSYSKTEINKSHI